MKDLNKVQLTGHVVADPDVRHTENGHVLTRFSVASNRRWKDQNGENQEETEWFNVVSWDRLAEICGDYLRKGSHVFLEGRLHTRTYDDPDSGQKRSFTEVVANELIMLDRRADSDDGTDADAPATATTTERAAARQEERHEQPAERTPERRRTRTRPTSCSPTAARAGRRAARPTRGDVEMAGAKVDAVPLVRSPLEFGRWFTKAAFEQHYGVRHWRTVVRFVDATTAVRCSGFALMRPSHLMVALRHFP